MNSKSVLSIEFTKESKIIFKQTYNRNIEFFKGFAAVFLGEEYRRIYDSLNADEGTWLKFVEQKSVNSQGEIKQFYYNYGKLIYVTYILGINDLHFENLIVKGVYPVIKDIETIFASYLFLYIQKPEYDAQYNATKKLMYGTMATGLVPVFDMSIDCGKDIIQGFNDANEIFRSNKQKIYKYIEGNIDKVESRIVPNVYWRAKDKCAYSSADSSMDKIMDVRDFDITAIKDIIEYQTSDNTIEEQKNLIYNAMLLSKATSVNYQEKGVETKAIKANPASEEVLRDNVDRNIILGKDNTIAWLGLIVNDQEKLEYTMADWSLYSGVSGIGLMYYTEWLNTGDRNAVAILQLILKTMKREYDLGKFESYDISYFCGLTGMYSFIKKVETIPGIELFGLKESLEKLIEKNIAYTNCYDLLSGVHSAVLYYYGDYKENYFSRKIITAITYHFMDNYKNQKMDDSCSFASFPHGYTGLMTSLLCMNRVVKDDRFSILIKKAWEKEKKLKVSDFNWIDNRKADGSSSHNWCHGSCGIMQARLFWYKEEFLGDIDIDYTEEELFRDLREYKKLIEASNINVNNYSLCHGNFALLDYLISFERLTGERMDKKYTQQIFEKAKEDGYSCMGTPATINPMGYMVGETGIRYLLNRYENKNIKSILVCENI